MPHPAQRIARMLVSGCLLSWAGLSAEPILVYSSGSLQLLVSTTNAPMPAILGFDIRGTIGFNVIDSVTAANLGPIFITDGTVPPFNLPPPPVPNHVLFVVNAVLPFGSLTFSNPSFGGPGLILQAAFAPFGPISDPAAQAFASVSSGNRRLDAGFAFVSSTSTGDTTLSLFAPVSVDSVATVPEPATQAAFAWALAALGVAWRRRAAPRSKA